MKQLKHEAELVKAAIAAGVRYAEARGAAVFEPRDSADEKVLYIYRLLIHDKLMQALPEDQVSQRSMRHKLALWYARQLPAGHAWLE
ncbi:MAG: DUF5062 family protein [Gammaproteobacteria bacterium]